MTCKWLITMVIVSPLTGVVGPLPNGRTLWLINGGDPNYLLSGIPSSKYGTLGKKTHIIPWVVPLPSNSGNEGLGWDSLLKMVHNPGGPCYWEGGQPNISPNPNRVKKPEKKKPSHSKGPIKGKERFFHFQEVKSYRVVMGRSSPVETAQGGYA